MNNNIKIDREILKKMVEDIKTYYLEDITDMRRMLSNTNDMQELYSLYCEMYKWENLANKAMEYQYDSNNTVDYSGNYEKYLNNSFSYAAQIATQMEIFCEKYGMKPKNNRGRQ